MIIETDKTGRVIAIAEDIEDVSQLVALRDLNRAHRAAAPAKSRKGKGGRKLGYKHPLKQCRECTRKVRYMSAHIRHKHLARTPVEANSSAPVAAMSSIG